jgi:ribosomal protein S6--L-glutamate ligase
MPTKYPHRPHICLVVRSDRLRRPGHLVPELVRHLEGRRARVDVVDPDVQALRLHDLRPAADLYVLASSSTAALSFAGALERCGATLFTSYATAAACRDKLVQTALLARAGVPVPASWLTQDPALLTSELEAGPLVCKYPRGSRGEGVHLVRRSQELRALPAGRPWLVMRYHQPDGPDLKMYRIGEQVHGVARVFPARTLRAKLGRPLTVSQDLRELVMRCSDALETTVCGVDVICSRGRRWVVDMSSFPGFKGVPDAPPRLAEVILQRARALHLERAS